MHSTNEMSVFTEVVQSGSFIEAGRRLGLTPSGVSKKISRFEDRLGVRLFNRTTRTLSLTEAGNALFDRCENILAEIEDAEDTARNLSSVPRGVLRIAASDALSLQVLVPFLQKFAQDYPEVSVLLLQGDGGINLLNERVDAALLFDRPAETSFIARKLIDDPWIICASPEYLEQHGTPRVPADLRHHRCLTIHAKGKTNDQWTFDGGDKGETIRINSVFSGIGLTVKAATLQNMGIARLAHFLVSSEIAAGKLKPILEDRIGNDSRAIYAVYPNRQHLPSKTRVFVDALNQYINVTLASP
ncbi:LysR family transcriptional regulator [Parasphingorhabdus cellanae]|uniref:LysR family transcriptional regulator n=1 Tax=Parasphingorhabdus cellanae TaxID=2806553 RepID=A0ABX7T6F3_9SPHN|nr:LysR family transcriptional regulator [Parasphingorhabdus cellanae]QTD55707.1 LysR family transcriptional regulator [Parasphingorhabdus cellanae]